jgi:hypothetical protein
MGYFKGLNTHLVRTSGPSRVTGEGSEGVCEWRLALKVLTAHQDRIIIGWFSAFRPFNNARNQGL